MRFSKLFAPTSKEPPKDALLKSHQFLVQAGFIQQIGSGIYNFLPLGQKVLQKIRSVVKEVMDSYGAQECMLGFVIPADLWRQSGRFDKYGKELLSLQDRKENDFVLSPTHEEVITELIKAYVKSYKQLPLHLYQIHTKFRDEIRPRFGLIRAREFVMKDGYSFHSSLESLDREFDRMEQAYSTIFKRLGLDFRAIEADSGAIGGNSSKEFVILSACGEDIVVVCPQCSYAANIEIAKRAKRVEPENIPQAHFAKFPTPNTPTIQALSAFFKVDPFFTLKAVAKQAVLEHGNSQLAIFFVRGDDSLEESKALNALSATLQTPVLSLEEVSTHTLEGLGLYPGYMGPYGLKHILPDVAVIFDVDLQDANSLICGANEKEAHFVGVDLATFEGLIYADIATTRANDACLHCQAPLEYQKSIEVGHIFKLGNKYSKSLNATYLDQEGKAQFFEMGCYGIGVSRLLSAILEQHSDEKGCVWSKASAPFEVVIIVANSKDAQLEALGESLYQELLSAGIDVLLDDRTDRFGAKMADFELMGCCYAIIVGNQALQSGSLEIIKRQGLTKSTLERASLVQALKEMLA
ncbi:prolyl-tRNA synthetase [Helicobacter bizzozeronii CIII-1]|uniref:Proline--tRNA ligase n=1 Tax=Helicobacter bizzozeronii (strain CIII-1) TaxID=1002804 RepID=F8KSU5_HELBC|nr:proline--tRNA ligase [Helicobacter bizzozeronii]CCB79879.1 prolyl-tRNA synthetase [Helicobacter bizzozeronii CIII-1]